MAGTIHGSAGSRHGQFESGSFEWGRLEGGPHLPRGKTLDRRPGPIDGHGRSRTAGDLG